MVGNEYKELVDFLGKRFEKIDEQFENINNRLDNTATKDDLANLRRETGVLYEDVQHKFDIVAEGMSGLNEKLDRFHDENEQGHTRQEERTLINSADISKLDQRVGRLEGKI